MSDRVLNITTNVINTKATQGLNQLSNNFKQLETNLNNINSKINNMSNQSNKATKQNDQLNKTINTQKEQMKEVDRSIDKTTKTTKKHTKAIDSNKKSTDNWLSSHTESMKIALKSIAIWGVATAAIYGMKRALDDAIQSLKDVDAEMVALRRVMNDLLTDFEELKDSAINLGVEFAQSTKEVLKSMVDWGRQGRNQIEVIELTRASLLAANVTQLEAHESVKFLTAALLQFNIDASEAVEIVDKWNEVANNFATTAVDLAESIKEAGAAANSAGVEIDELIGMTTALTASTAKSGNRIGNALKTMFSRIRGDMGTVADEVLGQVESSLNDIGIALRINQDTYRSTTDVLGDLASKWDTLTEVMQDNIARAIGGRRRYSDVIALIENWDIAMQATTQSMNSLNSAMEENETFMESLNARWDKAMQAGDRLIQTIGEAGLENAIINVTSAIENVFNKINDFVIGLNDLSGVIKWLIGGAGIAGLIIAFKKLNGVVRIGSNLLIAFGKTATTVLSLKTLGIAALIAGLAVAITKWGEYQRELKEATKIKKELNQVTERGNELTKLEINNAEKQVVAYRDMISEFLDAQQTLGSMSGLERLINLPSIYSMTSKNQKIINELKLVYYDVWKQAGDEFNKIIRGEESPFSDIGSFKDSFPSLQEVFIGMLNKELDKYQKALESTTGYIEQYANEQWEMIEQGRRNNKQLQAQIEAYNQLANTSNKTAKEEARLKAIISDLESQFHQLITAGEGFREELRTIGEESSSEYGTSGSKIQETINLYTGMVDQLYENKDKLQQSRKDYSRELQMLEWAISQPHIKKGSEAYQELNEDIEKAELNLKKASSQVEVTEALIELLIRRIKILKGELDDSIDQTGFFISLAEFESPLDALIKKFEELKQSIIDMKFSLDIDLETLDVFSGILGFDKIDKLKEQKNIYESVLSESQKIYKELLALQKDPQLQDFDKFLSAAIESFEGYDDLGLHLKQEFEENMKKVFSETGDLEVAIERAASDLVFGYAKGIQDKIKGIEIDMSLLEIKEVTLNDIKQMSKDELKGFVEEINKILEEEIASGEKLNLESYKYLAKQQISYIEKESGLGAILENIMSIMDIDPREHPITGDVAKERVKSIEETFRIIGEQINDIDFTQIGIEQLEDILVKLQELQFEEKVTDISLADLLGVDLEGFPQEVKDVLEKTIQKIEDLELIENIKEEYIPDLTELEKAEKDLVKVRELHNKGYREARKVIGDILIRITELQNKAREEDFDKYLTESFKEIEEILEDIDITDAMNIEYAQKQIQILQIELKKLELKKATGLTQLSGEEAQQVLAQIGLTEEKIKKIMKVFEEYIKDTEWVWEEAISEGLLSAFRRFDEYDDFSNKLIKSLEEVISNLWNNAETRQQLRDLFEDVGDWIDTTFDLNIGANITLGLEQFTQAVSQGKSLGRSFLGGIGNILFPGIGGIIGDFVGGIGELIVGKDTGLKAKEKVEQVNDALKKGVKYLKEFGISFDADFASITNEANWLEKFFGKSKWEAKGLKDAENDLEKMNELIDSIKSTFSSLGQGFANSLKQATDKSEFLQHFRSSVGEALKQSMIDAILKGDTISQLLKGLTKEIALATEDGIITDEELAKIKEVYASAKGGMENAWEQIEKIMNEFGMDFEEDYNISNSFQAGSTTNITYHQQYVVKSELFMGTEEEAEQAARWLMPYIREELNREAGR